MQTGRASMLLWGRDDAIPAYEAAQVLLADAKKWTCLAPGHELLPNAAAGKRQF